MRGHRTGGLCLPKLEERRRKEEAGGAKTEARAKAEEGSSEPRALRAPSPASGGGLGRGLIETQRARPAPSPPLPRKRGREPAVPVARSSTPATAARRGHRGRRRFSATRAGCAAASYGFADTPPGGGAARGRLSRRQFSGHRRVRRYQRSGGLVRVRLCGIFCSQWRAVDQAGQDHGGWCPRDHDSQEKNL